MTGCWSRSFWNSPRKQKAAWVAWHDTIEKDLATGRMFEGLRDIASKGADNVARAAAQFHMLEHGPEGQIDIHAVETAGRLVGWHLSEALESHTKRVGLSPHQRDLRLIDE
jgi:hypothetical protein